MSYQAVVLSAADVEVAIRRRIEDFGRLFAARDLTAFVELYDLDGVHCAPGLEPFRGRDQIQAFVEMLWQAGTSGLRLQPERFQGRNDLVVEFGRYDWESPGPNGQLRPDHGKYVNVWQLQTDGSQRIAFQMWHSDLPPGV